MNKLTFTKDWTNPTDFPTYEVDEAKVRADIQLLHNETKAAINNLIDDLEPTVNNNHAHDNKALLDTYTQTEANLADAVGKKHSHADLIAIEWHLSRTDNPHSVISSQIAFDSFGIGSISAGNVQNALIELDNDIIIHKAQTNNPHSVTASQVGAYSKVEMQTSGGASLHWGNLTNVPNMADSSWKTSVANRAALPLSGNTINDQRVVLDDGDGKQAMYVCIATTGNVDAQWKKIGDVDWTNDHGNLVGLGDDDHTQYHNDVRGDARYYKKAEVDTLLDDKSGVVVREKEFTATAGQTVFDVSSVGTYVPGSNLMNVYKKNIAGVYEELDRDNFTETSGTVVTLVYPAMVNDDYRFRWYENNPEYLNGTYAKKDGTLQTGLNADLLDGQHGNYYAKASDVSALLGVKNATITTTWVGASAPYTQEISVTGMEASHNPLITPVYSTTNATAVLQQTAWNQIGSIVTGAGKITVTCFGSKPTTAIPIQIKGV